MLPAQISLGSQPISSIHQYYYWDERIPPITKGGGEGREEKVLWKVLWSDEEGEKKQGRVRGREGVGWVVWCEGVRRGAHLG